MDYFSKEVTILYGSTIMVIVGGSSGQFAILL